MGNTGTGQGKASAPWLPGREQHASLELADFPHSAQLDKTPLTLIKKRSPNLIPEEVSMSVLGKHYTILAQDVSGEVINFY